jgi:hypothetical protein
MLAILRSYYDPIIVACIFRWLRSTEVWWGDDPRAVRDGLTAVIRRTGLPERAMLVSELLLAAAQGKLPSHAFETLTVEARVLLDSNPHGAEGPLKLGLVLLEEYG